MSSELRFCCSFSAVHLFPLCCLGVFLDALSQVDFKPPTLSLRRARNTQINASETFRNVSDGVKKADV